MPSRNVVIKIVIVLVIVAFAVYLIFIRGGTPGGPIIVIDPSPEYQTLADGTSVVTGYKADWYLGCPIATPPHAKPAAIDDIPSRYLTWPGAEKIEVRVRSSSVPLIAGKVSLTIDGDRKLEITHASAGAIPSWSFKGASLLGSGSVVEPDWPEEMFGTITDLQVYDLKNKDLSVKLDDLAKINIHHNRWSLFKKCP